MIVFEQLDQKHDFKARGADQGLQTVRWQVVHTVG